jgi:uncharacterized protein YutE (UPF0331/DUF86 family)
VERILQKIGRVKEYLSLLRSIKDDCLNRFVADLVYRGALLHYLYLMADSCIALAELVIKHRGLRIPQSYAEGFDILGENGILDPSFAYSFARISGFRNFLAHDYEGVDVKFICEDILSKLDDVDTFLKQIEKSVHPS